MGVVTARHLYHLLWAATTYADAQDPATDINQYLIANQLLTRNVRSDSGQPEAWRDYQQILAEFGLIFSHEVIDRIRPTPVGLAFLDGALSFHELMAYQALRFQYPNGHHVDIAANHRRVLATTAFAPATTITAVQELAGIRIRPVVLAWNVLRRLEQAGEVGALTVSDLETYLFRCATHDDTDACVNAIFRNRRKDVTLPTLGPTARRNAQDWVKFMLLTGLFSGIAGRSAHVKISAFARGNSVEIDSVCDLLARPETFWHPSDLDHIDQMEWYAYFGTVDLSVPLTLLAQEPGAHDAASREETETNETESAAAREIQLSQFEPIVPATAGANTETIESVYSAELANSAHRLHDAMVNLIATQCTSRGATVLSDPFTVDLLVQFRAKEFIVEVKSVTSRNYIPRLRYAIGQLFHYDYLRSLASEIPRRCVLGVTGQVPPESWTVHFVTNHLDFDLLSLQDRALQVRSNDVDANALFGPKAP